MRMCTVPAFAAVVIGLVGSTSSANAQAGNARKTLSEPVTVALVENLPVLGDGSRKYEALILRRRDIGDVILLPRSSASGELLDAAARTLMKVRAKQFERADRIDTYRGRRVDEITVGVKASVAPPDWKAHHVPLAQKVVDRLLSSTRTRTIEKIGKVKVVRFYPPVPKPKQAS